MGRLLDKECQQALLDKFQREAIDFKAFSWSFEIQTLTNSTGFESQKYAESVHSQNLFWACGKNFHSGKCGLVFRNSVRLIVYFGPNFFQIHELGQACTI